MTDYLILSLISLLVMMALFGVIGVLTVLSPRLGKALTFPLFIGVLTGTVMPGHILPGLTGFAVGLLLLGAVAVKRRKKASQDV